MLLTEENREENYVKKKTIGIVLLINWNQSNVINKLLEIQIERKINNK